MYKIARLGAFTAVLAGILASVFALYDEEAVKKESEPANISNKAESLVQPCSNPDKTFDIHALQANITYNQYGEHDPNGRVYVLADDLQAIEEAKTSNKPVNKIQPLTIRANKGDCIEVNFTNELSEKASIHIQGVEYDILSSDGMAVGTNPDSTADSQGGTIQYRWYAKEEGIFFFQNGADMTAMTDPADHKGTLSHGLFGALIVEPEGATWTDPQTGEPLKSGLYADIHLKGESSFREFSLFFHDGVEYKTADGAEDQEVDGSEAGLYAVNYRAEPLHERIKAATTEDGKNPSNFYSSWIHGDPSTPINKAYVGDRVKYRIIGVGMEENHVFHLHGHRWKTDSKKTHTVDAETLNIGDAQTAELVNGAGYVKDGKGAPGDYLWHCHLFPHYLEGMWGMLRVYDKLQPDLLPLPGHDTLPAEDAENLGFPNFIPSPLTGKTNEVGKTGKTPFTAPDPELRPATSSEEKAFKTKAKNFVPGAPSVDRCPKDAPLRQYTVAGIQTKIVYNNAGDHDKEGRMYVLKEDMKKVLSGEKKPRPLVIRANHGDCVEVTLENHLNEAELHNELSLHIHFVGYDPLASDGTVVGWNYYQGTKPGKNNKIRYRWYADEEGSILFHDHMTAGEKGFHGTFGALIVEPAGSEWLDPKTGLPLKSGTEAVIKHETKEDFREQVLMYHDFARLWDKSGNMLPLEAPPEHFMKAHGYMGVNYSNEPFFRRNNADPAYVFSSWVHGDPQTPIIESYPGDPIKIRLIQGAHETQHNFELHGLDWKRETENRDSDFTSNQVIGTSEQFNFDIQPNPAGVGQRDYLWTSQPIEDLWSGLWGFVRIWDGQKEGLITLPDRPNLKKKISKSDASKMKKEKKAPPKARGPGNSCPAGSPRKQYHVTAFMKDIQYNNHGDHDPYGIMFALSEDVDDIISGTKKAEPLVLRANAGDCIQVTLKNELPEDPPENKEDPALLMSNQVSWNNSNRVSMHAQMLEYDVQGSDGATVGYNYDQTVGPKQQIVYRWYADKEYGGTIFFDYGDIRSHRLHGAYGSLIIEPPEAEYLNPETGEKLNSGSEAIISIPDAPDFREQVLMFTDGLYVTGINGSAPTPGEAHMDMEDRGEKGINYRSEPFSRRFAVHADKSLVFSSLRHGDPSTPLPEAYVKDPTRFRVLHPADRSRGSVFSLHGHSWPFQWTDAEAKVVGSQGSLTPGESLDIIPIGGAGGFMERAGDYLYREMKLNRYLEGGNWGIFRVHDKPKKDVFSLPDRRPAPPTGVQITVLEENQSRMIFWDLPEGQPVNGFNIYRTTAKSKTVEKINVDVVKETSFIDKAGEQQHSYFVTAVDQYGNESFYSDEAMKINNFKEDRLKP